MGMTVPPGAVFPQTPVAGRAGVTVLFSTTQAAWSFVAHPSTLRKGREARQRVGLPVPGGPGLASMARFQFQPPQFSPTFSLGPSKSQCD